MFTSDSVLTPTHSRSTLHCTANTTIHRRCAVYRFDPETKEWKERGRGECKFLQHRESYRIRIVVRQDKTLYVRLNHYIPDEPLTANCGSDRAWTWRCTDFSGEGDSAEIRSFAIRFATTAKAQDFYKQWESARSVNVQISSGTYVHPAADVDADAATPSTLSNGDGSALADPIDTKHDEGATHSDAPTPADDTSAAATAAALDTGSGTETAQDPSPSAETSSK
uniref:Ran-specific GTPase-activating protein 1 n=1 Tax=Lygus hesperus TaxID=30085 RepID=A0A0A9XXT1_LYGHE